MSRMQVCAAGWGDRLRRPGLLSVAMGLMLVVGCQKPAETIQDEKPKPQASFVTPSVVKPKPAPRPSRVIPEERMLGKSVEGRPIKCRVYGEGGETVFIFAGIHGDEPAGVPLVQELAEYIETHPELVRNRRIILMEEANPDGLARYTRVNARNIDLNRNFPAGNFEAGQQRGKSALSEPESRILCDLLDSHRPERVVSIHQPNRIKPCIDFDGPGEGLAKAMARHCELPIIKLGSRPGSLGSYAGLTLGLPIITLELPRTTEDDNGPILWDRYGRMMLSAICYPEPVHAVDVPTLAE